MTAWYASTSDSAGRGQVAYQQWVLQDDWANNRSLLGVAIGLFDGNGSYGGYGTGSWNCGINGGQVGADSVGYNLDGSNVPGWFWSTSVWVSHNGDGSKYVDGWASFSGSSPVGSATASGGFGLTDFQFVPNPPAAPALSRTAGTRTVTINSQVPSSALTITDYHWQYSTDGGSNWSAAQGMGTGRVASFTAELGTTYQVRTRAYSSEGWGSWGTANSIVIPNTPAAPATISGTRSGRSVSLSCGTADPRGATVTGYYAHYSFDGGATWSAAVAMANQAYTFNALTPSRTYIFRTYAVNEMGAGVLSAQISIDVPAGGRRLTDTGFQSTTIAKRLTESGWVDLTIAKRLTESGWVDLS